MIYKDPPSPIIDSPASLASENINQYLQSNGRNNAVATPVTLPVKFCLLTTKGRISSQWKRTPLFYTTYKGSVYVVASNGGKDEAPYWYKNALVNPVVWIQHDFDEYWAVCREVDAATESDLRNIVWNKINTIYPMYNHFQQKTSVRILPVVEIRRI